MSTLLQTKQTELDDLIDRADFLQELLRHQISYSAESLDAMEATLELWREKAIDVHREVFAIEQLNKVLDHDL